MFKRMILLSLLLEEICFAQLGSPMQGIWHLENDGVFEDLSIRDHVVIDQGSSRCEYVEIVVALSETRILFDMILRENCGGGGGGGAGFPAFLRPVAGHHYKEIYYSGSGSERIIGRLYEKQIVLQDITFVGGYFMKEHTFRVDLNEDGSLSWLDARTESDPSVGYFTRRSTTGILVRSRKSLAAFQARLENE